jgi:membrane-bound metal-dependent hydrolase YbcI (DUF457 family)
MQIGHVAVALVLSSYAPELTGGRIEAFSVQAIVVSFVGHFLPNWDVIPIWLKIAKDSFHCTWTHSLLFALVVGLILLPFNVGWAALCFFGILMHLLADLPSSVGLPLFLPWKRRFTIKLWADTGHSGMVAFKGSYAQAWTWILEGSAFVVLFIRVYQERAWPF